jgi:transposase-like protein
LEQVARLGAQLLMQAALEAELTEFLGRDRYQRSAACDDARPGSRNGYREVTVKTTAGPVMLARGRSCAARRRSSPPGCSVAT